MVELASEYENEPTKITVTKTDLTTGVELEGAKLTVLDQDGNIVDSWASVKGEEHLIERLTVGETYTLREELAPVWLSESGRNHLYRGGYSPDPESGNEKTTCRRER